MNNNDNEYISNVERDILEKYLFVIRDVYPIFYRFYYYVQSNFSEISIKDDDLYVEKNILENFILFSKENVDRQEKLNTIKTISQNLTRRLFDTTEQVIYSMKENILELIDQYKSIVLPIKDNPLLLAAPGEKDIDADMVHFDRLHERARGARDEIQNIGLDRAADAGMTVLQYLKDRRNEMKNYINIANEVHLKEEIIRLQNKIIESQNKIIELQNKTG